MHILAPPVWGIVPDSVISSQSVYSPSRYKRVGERESSRMTTPSPALVTCRRARAAWMNRTPAAAMRGRMSVSTAVRVDCHSFPVCAVTIARSSRSKSREVGSSSQRKSTLVLSSPMPQLRIIFGVGSDVLTFMKIGAVTGVSGGGRRGCFIPSDVGFANRPDAVGPLSPQLSTKTQNPHRAGGAECGFWDRVSGVDCRGLACFRFGSAVSPYLCIAALIAWCRSDEGVAEPICGSGDLAVERTMRQR